MKMNADLLKKMKNAIYSKPLKSFNQFYTINKNYNNMLINLLDDSKLNKNKNIMISELDIKLNSSQSESYDKIELDKKNIINTNKNEAKTEFKKQLTENLIKYLQKNEKNNNSNDIEYKNKNKKDIILKAKKALNLTSITPLNKRFNTININRNNDEKIIKKKYFIKINNKINTNKQRPIIINNNKKEFLIKKLKNKNIKLFLEKINTNTKKKNNNTIIINQPHKSLLLTSTKINMSKNNPTINDNKKIKSINLKFNKNTSFKEKINNSNNLRSSFKKVKITKEYNHIKNYKIFNSNSKSKEKFLSKNKLIYLSNGKNTFTENIYNYNNNTSKNISNKKKVDNNFIKKKINHNKYRNLTLKEINLLNNNLNLNISRSNYCSFLNNNYNNKEKKKNFSTIENEKKTIISPLYKKLKIHVKKNIHNMFNKNPINIVNININRNNNFIMNINNDNFINSINNNNKIMNSSSKIEGKIKKFCSFQDFLTFNENYKRNILKRFSKEKKKNNILEMKNIPFIKKIDINKNQKIN